MSASANSDRFHYQLLTLLLTTPPQSCLAGPCRSAQCRRTRITKIDAIAPQSRCSLATLGCCFISRRMMTRRLPATARRMISIRPTCTFLIGLKYIQILAHRAGALTMFSRAAQWLCAFSVLPIMLNSNRAARIFCLCNGTIWLVHRHS